MRDKVLPSAVFSWIYEGAIQCLFYSILRENFGDHRLVLAEDSHFIWEKQDLPKQPDLCICKKIDVEKCSMLIEIKPRKLRWAQFLAIKPNYIGRPQRAH